MSSYAGTHVIDHHVGESFLSDQVRHTLRILDAVPVEYADHAVFPVRIQFKRRLHSGDQRPQRFLSSPDSPRGFQLSFRRHCKDRFDIHKASHNSSRLRHTSSPLKMIEVVHGKKYIHMLPLFQKNIVHFLHALSRFPQLHAAVHGHALPQGCVQGIKDHDLPLRIILQELIRRHHHIIAAPAERAGECNVQDVLSLFQDSLKSLPDHRRVVRHRFRKFALPHRLIEFMRLHVQLITVDRLAKRIVLRDDRELILSDELRPHIGIRISSDHILRHRFFLLAVHYISAAFLRQAAYSGVTFLLSALPPYSCEEEGAL